MKDLLYVANAGEDTISVISTENLRETKRINLRGGMLGPRRLLLCGGALYAINSYGSSVSRVELAAQRQSEQSVGAYPSGLCKCGGSLLVCCGETNNVYSIDCASFRCEACASAGIFPVSIAGAGESALVSCMLSCEVLRIDAQLNVLQRFPLAAMPLDAAQVDDAVFVSALETDGGGALYRFDAQGTLTGRKDCRAAGKLCPVRGKKAVAAHLWDNGVSIVDCDTLEVARTLPTAVMPDDVVCDGERIYVSCMLGDCVDVLSFDGEIIGRVAVGREPRGLALSDAPAAWALT